jgi:creatinine amidohydrolase/Fe(II)-dependent formamide hydrolase-like protein
VKATALSVANHGVRKILIVNGYEGNTAALLEVAGELRRLHEIFAVVMMAFLSNMMEAGRGHAGAGETNVNLYLHGHQVKLERAVDTKQRNKLGSLEVSGYAGLGPAQYPWDT